MNTVKVIRQSHVDHGLSPEQLAWLLDQVADRTSFFIETLTLPAHLGTVECGLVGPATGLPAVGDEDVVYVVRGNRKWTSRMLREPRAKPRTREVSVIAGPAEGHEGLVLYTAYGGPVAPREPGDTTIPDWDGVRQSREFWAEHALVP
jgi:hypothetical protein